MGRVGRGHGVQTCTASFNSALDLDSFLLKPMQRVTKMPLLVKGILKSTAAGTFYLCIRVHTLSLSHTHTYRERKRRECLVTHAHTHVHTFSICTRALLRGYSWNLSHPGAQRERERCAPCLTSTWACVIARCTLTLGTLALLTPLCTCVFVRIVVRGGEPRPSGPPPAEGCVRCD
jgi:hypothetical protein